MWLFVDSNPFWTWFAMTNQHHQPIKLISLISFYHGKIKLSRCHFTERETVYKTGYSTALIINALLYRRMLLNETHLSNQHVEIARMFVDSEFFITELTALAYFTHHVSLPLLNFLDVNSEDKLLETFPELFQGLKNGKIDTLSDYLVVHKHVPMEPPTSETDHLLLKAV